MRRRHRRRPLHLLAVVALVAVLAAATSVLARLPPGEDLPGGGIAVAAPDAPAAEGYFSTRPAGAWRSLPGDAACARQVRRSPWEPRPSNTQANHTKPATTAVQASFAARPRGGVHDTYDRRWNGWLLPRVDGQHTGTTDENIQWAACKWGISDNLLRAMAAAESTWYQYLTDGDGRCVQQRGCGDMVPTATPASRVYCRMVDRFGHAYSGDYRPGVCPRTFSIIGVMSWQDPAWGRMPENQNGTFPFNRDSTAFALDYAASFLRGCQEGWIRWLHTTGDYAPGEIWGCVGVWYAGTWQSADAKEYASRVRELLDRRVWLRPDFAEPVHASSSGVS